MSARRLLVGLFVLTLPLVTPKIRGADEIEYFSYLRSFVFDHDLEFGNEYAHFYERDPVGLEGFKTTFLDRREPSSGNHINFAPLGTALLWSPFYLLAHLGVLAARGLGFSVAADGYGLPYVAAACYASALYGFLGLLLIHDFLKRQGMPEPAAAGSVASLWLATPVLYYMSLGPGFSHAVSLFTVALLVWLSFRALEKDGGSVGRWAAIGAVGGVAGLIREQDALFLVIPALLLVAEARRRRDPGYLLPRAVALPLASILVFAPQLLAYHAINGSYRPSHLVARKMTYWSPHFLQVLVDPGHGLFLWSPILALAALGLVAAALRRGAATARVLLVGLLLQVWINGSVESWSSAGAFGARRFVASTPLFAFGLAVLLAFALPRVGRVACAAVLGLTIWWNVSLMIQFGLRLMDRQRLEWPKVAVNQVTEVPPRLARVAWLFFTDRERLVREGP